MQGTRTPMRVNTSLPQSLQSFRWQRHFQPRVRRRDLDHIGPSHPYRHAGREMEMPAQGGPFLPSTLSAIISAPSINRSLNLRV